MDRTNTNFPKQLQELLKKYRETLKEDDGLKYYQKLIPYLFEQEINSRGILLNWKMGLGKTLGSLGIAHTLQKQGKKVIVITKRTQRQNIIDSVKKYNDLTKTSELSADKLEFITLSSSIRKQIVELVLEGFNPNLAKNINYINEKFAKVTLNDYIVIIDEAQDLFRMIANGSESAVEFYYLVMRSPQVKLVFLTGTPIPGDPFVIAPCFNMLAEAPAIFPENKWDFEKYFVDRENKKLKNREKFQNRIYGLVSSVGYFPDILKFFPKNLGTQVVEVPMDPYQYGLYQIARQKEQAETKNYGIRKNTGAFSKNQTIGSSYRVLSRQISNVVKPAKYINTPVDEIPYGELVSPKFERMIKDAENRKGISLIYSQFTGEGGLASLRHFLRGKGWFDWNRELKKTNFQKNKTFAYFDGSVSDEIIDKIMEVMKSEENKDGEIIKILMFGITGAVGLDPKSVRQTQMTEPYWTPDIPDQFVARAIRFKGHEFLPEKERDVQNMIYLSVHPPGATALQKSKKTTDQEIYEMANSLREIIDDFYSAMDEVSVECQFLRENCRICAPTNVPLFNSNKNRNTTASLIRDIADPNPCQEIEEKEIDAKGIIVEIDGEKREYFYRKDESSIWKYQIFSQDESLGAYRELSPKDPIFQLIIEKLKKMNK